jgi:hypothetical protein
VTARGEAPNDQEFRFTAPSAMSAVGLDGEDGAAGAVKLACRPGPGVVEVGCPVEEFVPGSRNCENYVRSRRPALSSPLGYQPARSVESSHS